MIAALVLLFGSMWSWNASDTATGYRLYWSLSPYTWDRAYSVDVPAQISSGTMEQFPLQQYDDAPIVHLAEPQPGAIFYFVVTAYNDAGESLTEHGDIIGPPPGVAVCP